MKNVLVVSNIHAGRRKAVLYKRAVHKFLLQKSKKFKIIEIDELLNIDFTDFDTVIVIGGDGTVNKVIPHIINTDKVLGIIPTGTANLLAADLGMTHGPDKNLEIIDKGLIKQIDVLSVNGKNSILRFGLGYDSDIICKTPQSLKNKFGYFAYFIAGIIFALKLKSKEYELITDNQSIKTVATCIIVSNIGNMYRDWISISKNSKNDDGFFEVFILKAKNPFTFFVEFLKIIFGISKNNTRVLYLKTNNLKIKNYWATCHIDGEKHKIKGDINITMQNTIVNVFYCKK